MKLLIPTKTFLIAALLLGTLGGAATAQAGAAEPPPPTLSSSSITACDRVIDRAWTASETDAEVARIYMAYFLRNPDADGMSYWRSVDAESGLEVVSWSFASSTEFQVRYGSLGTEDFLTLMYDNIMCRAPDAEGFWYWHDLIEAGEVDRSTAFLLFSQSPEFKMRTGTN